MIKQTFHWQGHAIPFRSGESLAAALEAAGVVSFGNGPLGEEIRYFCGIGACQNCLLRVDGLIREACVTSARPGMQVEPLEKSNG